MNKQHLTFTKRLKIIMLSIFSLFSFSAFSQAVGVNTKYPLGIFHVDGKTDNAKNKPTQTQQANDFIITIDGNVGIGTTTPDAKLHIVSEQNPIQIEGITEGDINTNNLLVIDKNNTVKKIPSLKNLPIPTPAVFILKESIKNFLSNDKTVKSQSVPMEMTINTIDGLTYEESTSTIIFPSGTYKISFIYEAIHENCMKSSYFINFPSSQFPEGISITSASDHRLNTNRTNHGGEITYITTLSDPTAWPIKLGRGDTGACNGRGMTLFENATQLIVYRLGD